MRLTENMPKSQKISDIVDLRIARFDAVISSQVISHTISQKHNLNIKTGQIMELFCTAHGRPLPEINWFKDGGVITSKSVSNKFIVSKFGATSSLRITDLKSSDSGTYACRAENINGHIKKWVFVTASIDPLLHLHCMDITPKMSLSTKASTTIHSQFKLRKNTPNPICEDNPCKIERCFERENGFTYKCKCPFPYFADKCKSHSLIPPNKRNSSALEERSTKCNITVNDQLFTIFETILVCIIASLFLGIICYIFRKKYCCFHNQRKKFCCQANQAIQAEINNFILVRDVGINVNGNYFEHGGDRLMPVAYKRNVSMIFQDARIQEITQHSRLLSTPNSSMSSPILYEDPLHTYKYTPFMQSFAHSPTQNPQSIYYNKSAVHDHLYDSSNEGLNSTKMTEHSKSESGICSCFEYSPRLNPISSALLIFNESVSPTLSSHDPRIQIESGQTNIIM